MLFEAGAVSSRLHLLLMGEQFIVVNLIRCWNLFGIAFRWFRLCSLKKIQQGNNFHMNEQAGTSFVCALGDGFSPRQRLILFAVAVSQLCTCVLISSCISSIEMKRRWNSHWLSRLPRYGRTTWWFNVDLTVLLLSLRFFCAHMLKYIFRQKKRIANGRKCFIASSLFWLCLSKSWRERYLTTRGKGNGPGERSKGEKSEWHFHFPQQTVHKLETALSTGQSLVTEQGKAAELNSCNNYNSTKHFVFGGKKLESKQLCKPLPNESNILKGSS